MMKLYAHSTPRASNTLKLRVALAEAGAAYEFIPVDLGAGEQKKPEFLALNPHGKVPVLVDDGFTLPESDAILWYIAEKYPEAALLPRLDGSLSSVQARARVLHWCDFGSTALYPAYGDYRFHTASGPAERRVPALAEAALARLTRALDALETSLARQGTPYLAGPAYAIGDIGVASVLQAVKEKLPVNPFTGRAAVTAWYGRVTMRPAWQKAIAADE